ncbi:MAG: hemerythrin domain-containing protein [Nitrospinota bacterium]|nr:MAG: hemerythrin domain-containing protein [Nitrospinota bacterium]
MKMKITEALRGEHGVFYTQFHSLQQTVSSANAVEQVQALVTLLATALEQHAQLEDDLLFTALDPHLGPMGPLAVMRREHDEIRETLARLQTLQDPAEAKHLALHAVQVALAHFAKEEQVLFPMAEQFLDAATLTQLGKRWAEQRGVSVS